MPRVLHETGSPQEERDQVTAANKIIRVSHRSKPRDRAGMSRPPSVPYGGSASGFFTKPEQRTVAPSAFVAAGSKLGSILIKAKEAGDRLPARFSCPPLGSTENARFSAQSSEKVPDSNYADA